MTDQNPNQQGNSLDLPLVKPGGRLTLLSASFANALIRRVNALTKLEVKAGTQLDFKLSDANSVLTIPNSFTDSSSTGSGNMNWKGAYSVASTYAVNDVVYDTTYPGIIMVWICAIAITSAGTHAPAWPYSGSPYWRMVGSTGLAVFRVEAVYDDYMDCKTWNGSSAGSTVYYVAKCAELRNPASETIDAQTINYTYSTYVDRSATDGVHAENHKISPRFIASNSIIYAAPVLQTIGGYDYGWLDCNVAGRAWVRTP